MQHTIRSTRSCWFTFMVLLAVGTLAVRADSVQPDSSENLQAYYRWALSCIEGIYADIPSMTKWAEKAAQRYVEDPGSVIVALGDDGFAGELTGRSGGIMRMQSRFPRNPSAAVVLYAIREDQIEGAAEQMHLLHEAGAMVIAFARPSVLQQAHAAGARWSTAVTNHAAPAGGLFKNKDGLWHVPTDTTANAIASWTWLAEFTSACARLGQMPVFFEGYAVPGGQEWARRLEREKFHDDTPYPAPAGQYGRNYLRALRKDIDVVFLREADNIRALASLVVDARNAGRGVYAFTHGHSIMYHHGFPGDPGFFTKLNRDWFSQKADITLQAGDLVFCVGFDQLFQGWNFKNWMEDAREAGASLVWSITDYNENPESGAHLIPMEEIFINQRWSFGDAVVNVPGHPIHICPTSGVIAEFVFWSANAAIADLAGF